MRTASLPASPGHARVQQPLRLIETFANLGLKESGCVFFYSIDKTLRLFKREWLAPVAFGDRLLMARHQVVKAVKRLLLIDETAKVRRNWERDGVVLSEHGAQDDNLIVRQEDIPGPGRLRQVVKIIFEPLGILSPYRVGVDL